MIIEPQIKGVVARSCHPYGCQQSIQNQIDYVKSADQIVSGPKKVLVLGASSGFGLASRIALAFGGAKADTIGISFERGPSEKGVGSAGWYNNIFFREAAERESLIAKNFVGDAFSSEMRAQVVEYIRNEFGGSVDLVVYSLATGVRPNPETGEMIRSSIKTVGEPLTGNTINLERDALEATTLDSASEQEISDTVKVMGGEDWQEWISFLRDEGVLAQGCKTVAYSYIGSRETYRIYHEGTLGRAKMHLHETADKLNAELSKTGGDAHVAVCKALVTKASVFIPAFAPYMLALFKVMKKKNIHEGCIEQMQRMFATRIYNADASVVTDSNRLVRMDDWELREDVQAELKQLLEKMSPENFTALGDYEGYKSEFMNLNGFGFDGINYNADINLSELTALQP